MNKIKQAIARAKNIEIDHVIQFGALLAINAYINYWGGDMYRDGKLIPMLFLGIVVAGGFLYFNLDKFLGLLIILAGAEWLVFGAKIYGAIVLMNVLAVIVVSFALSDRQDLFLRILKYSFYLQGFFGVMQVIEAPYFAQTQEFFRGRFLGTMGQHMLSGAFMAALVPIAFKFWGKTERFVAVIFTIMTYSSTAIVGILVGGVYYLWFKPAGKKKYVLKYKRAFKWTAIVASILLPGAVLLPQFEFFSFSGRWVPWKAAVKAILERPLFGYGPGAWFGEYTCSPDPAILCLQNRWGVNDFKDRWVQLHNDWLQLAHETGIVGLLLALAATFFILKKLTQGGQLWAACTLVTILVCALGSFPFHFAPTSLIFCTVLAIGIRNAKV